MGKILAYYKQDGAVNTIKFILSAITAPIYKKSETEFVKIDLKRDWNTLAIDGFQFRKMELSELDGLDFPRLKSQPYKKWFEIGSELYVGFYNNQPATYSWIHYAYHDMGVLGKFILNNGECWIGPTFVDNKFRGKGLNKAQMLFNFRDARAEIGFGSFNSLNTASKVSCLKVGFIIYGKAIVKSLFGHKKIQIEGELLKEHLKS